MSDSILVALMDALRALLTARLEMRQRIHALGLNSRERWGRIESAISDVEDTYAAHADEMTDDFGHAVIEFSRAVRLFVDRELGRPFPN